MKVNYFIKTIKLVYKMLNEMFKNANIATVSCTTVYNLSALNMNGALVFGFKIDGSAYSQKQSTEKYFSMIQRIMWSCCNHGTMHA